MEDHSYCEDQQLYFASRLDESCIPDEQKQGTKKKKVL
jgi:hypothetical protein